MARIMFTSWPLRGHCVQLFALAEELSARGHEVALAIPEPGDAWARGLELPVLPWEPSSSRHAGDFARELARVFQEASRETLPWRTEVTFSRYMCDSYFRILDGIRPLLHSWHPDLLVTDHAMLPSVELGQELGVPTFRVSCFLGGMVPTSSGVPHWTSDLPRRMTWGQSLHNRLLSLVDTPIDLLARRLESSRRLRGNSSASLAELLARTPLLVGSCFGVEVPRPLPSWVQLIGPIRSFRHPLMSDDLRSWLEEGAEPNVAYVSFGTLAVIERRQAMALLQGLTRAGLRVLWSLPSARQAVLPRLPDNVRVESYIAQDDVLTHPSVRLFVTHGGRNSLHESLWHDRPMLCMPFFGDQYYNSARLLDAGVAIRLHKDRLEACDVQEAAERLMRQPSYARAAAKLGAVLRAARGRERASDIIEGALHAGTEHLF